MRALFILLLPAILLSGCTGETTQPPTPVAVKKHIDVQGHRGARGNRPENSLQAFQYALEQGVNTLELDVVISKDSQVVVSHEPWINPEICFNAEGPRLNMYEMTYNEIRFFDCGSKGHPNFPDQRLETTYKPLLSEALLYTETWLYEHGAPGVVYNIEIKSTPEGDGVLHPPVADYARLVDNVIRARGLRQRVTIQSFDVRALQAMRQLDSLLPLVLLVENDLGFQANMDALGFTPAVYSPYYKLVDAQLVQQVHAADMKLVPWTVNDSTEIINLLNLGVDGIITDYPKLGVTIARNHQQP